MELISVINLIDSLPSFCDLLPDMKWAYKAKPSSVWSEQNRKLLVDFATSVEIVATLYRVGLYCKEFARNRGFNISTYTAPKINSLYRSRPIGAAKSYHMCGMAVDLSGWDARTFSEFFNYWKARTKTEKPWSDWTVDVEICGLKRKLDLAPDNFYLEWKGDRFNCAHLVPGFHWYKELPAPGRSEKLAMNSINSRATTNAVSDVRELAPPNLKDKYDASTQLLYNTIAKKLSSLNLVKGTLNSRGSDDLIKTS